MSNNNTAKAAVPQIADSKSLHNYTLSPGWTKEEVEILKIALMKFGIGRWKKIKKYNFHFLTCVVSVAFRRNPSHR
jgi:hypothetical protein